MFFYSWLGMAFCISNLRAEHYVKGFAFLDTYRDVLVLAPLLALVLVFFSRQLADFLTQKNNSKTILVCVVLGLGINIILFVYLLLQSIQLQTGLWLEHLWHYDGVTYRNYSFEPIVSYLGFVLLFITSIIHWLSLNGLKSQSLWLTILCHIPVALVGLLLWAQRTIEKPYFIG